MRALRPLCGHGSCPWGHVGHLLVTTRLLAIVLAATLTSLPGTAAGQPGEIDARPVPDPNGPAFLVDPFALQYAEPHPDQPPIYYWAADEHDLARGACVNYTGGLNRLPKSSRSLGYRCVKAT